MSPEKRLEINTILKNRSVQLIGSDYRQIRSRLVNHYFTAWNPEGLCHTRSEAADRLDAYNHQGIMETSSVVAKRNDKEDFNSLLLATKFHADSPLDVAEKISNYPSLKFTILGKDKGRYPITLCFSITADKGLRVSPAPGKADISLSEFHLSKYPLPSNSFMLAYSRVRGVGNLTAYEHYINNLNNPKVIGPTGMHETKYGGITLLILNKSRPEDSAGGGANFLVLLPRSEGSKLPTRLVMDERRRKKEVPYEKIGPFVLFTDFDFDGPPVLSFLPTRSRLIT